ncbi:hypothetical protein DPMN_141580 [Dreissena polymorpha]|uniref:Uncharacterized protein n=1 Tax=Dreissena polymorpha TaxID=45954 RepID=A0A9D4G9Q7_DREPO|nr:hypothetical protein DPMN_141580 [Dreissena polymorpha]
MASKSPILRSSFMSEMRNVLNLPRNYFPVSQIIANQFGDQWQLHNCVGALGGKHYRYTVF